MVSFTISIPSQCNLTTFTFYDIFYNSVCLLIILKRAQNPTQNKAYFLAFCRTIHTIVLFKRTDVSSGNLREIEAERNGKFIIAYKNDTSSKSKRLIYYSVVAMNLPFRNFKFSTFQKQKKFTSKGEEFIQNFLLQKFLPLIYCTKFFRLTVAILKKNSNHILDIFCPYFFLRVVTNYTQFRSYYILQSYHVNDQIILAIKYRMYERNLARRRTETHTRKTR